MISTMDRRGSIMTLYKGKQNIGRNIKTEEAAGRPRKQAIAIALSEAGESRKRKTKFKKGSRK